MPDNDEEKIDSQIDPSEEDENTDSDDEGASDDADDDSADDDSNGDEGDGSEPAYTPREKQMFARMKKAQGFKLEDGKWVKPQKKTTPTPEPKTESKSGVDEALVDSKVKAALDKRDLDSLEVSNELKTEIKNYAKLHNVSIKAASTSSYIQFRKEEEDKKARSEEAAAGTKRKAQPKSDFTDASPNDFDLSTEQGRKDWDSYKNWLKTQ